MPAEKGQGDRAPVSEIGTSQKFSLAELAPAEPRRVHEMDASNSGR